MKRYCIEVACALTLFVGTSAKAATALVFAHGTEDVAEAAKADWKNEKMLLERLATVGQAEISTTLVPGQHAAVIGVCEKSDADALMPMLKTLFPTMEAIDSDAKAAACPTLLSKPTKVIATFVDPPRDDKKKQPQLIVALFEGVWNKGETIQVAVASVRDKDGDVVDNFSQRAGTILGGETCKTELTTAAKVAVLTRKCEGTNEVETIKLSLVKGRLKQE